METIGTEFSVSLPEFRVSHIQGDVQYTSDCTHASFPILFKYVSIKFVRGRVLVGKPEGRRQMERPRRRWEDNFKVGLLDVGGGGGGLDGVGSG
jgi:hypothetical protein